MTRALRSSGGEHGLARDDNLAHMPRFDPLDLQAGGAGPYAEVVLDVIAEKRLVKTLRKGVQDRFERRVVDQLDGVHHDGEPAGREHPSHLGKHRGSRPRGQFVEQEDAGHHVKRPVLERRRFGIRFDDGQMSHRGLGRLA